MKQGSGKNVMSGAKVEPTSHSISIDKVANIGQQIVRTVPPTKDLVNGRGYTAPKDNSVSHHKGGSQGKY